MVARRRAFYFMSLCFILYFQLVPSSQDRRIISYMTSPQLTPMVKKRYEGKGLPKFLAFINARYQDDPMYRERDDLGLPTSLSGRFVSTSQLLPLEDLFIVYAWWLYTEGGSNTSPLKASVVNLHFQALAYDFKLEGLRHLASALESVAVRFARNRHSQVLDPRNRNRVLSSYDKLPISGQMLYDMLQTHLPYLEFLVQDILFLASRETYPIDYPRLDAAMAAMAGLFLVQLGARASNAVKTESDTTLRAHYTAITQPPPLETVSASNATGGDTAGESLGGSWEEALDRHAVQAQDVKFMWNFQDGFHDARGVSDLYSDKVPGSVLIALRTSKTNQRGDRLVERLIEGSCYGQELFVKCMWLVARVAGYRSGTDMFFSRRAEGKASISKPRKRIRAQDVAAVVKRQAEALGLDPKRFGTKSFKYTGISAVSQAVDDSRTVRKGVAEVDARAVAKSFDHASVSSNARYIKPDPRKVPYPLELLGQDGSGLYEHSALQLKVAMAAKPRPLINEGRISLPEKCSLSSSCRCRKCYPCDGTPLCPCRFCVAPSDVNIPPRKRVTPTKAAPSGGAPRAPATQDRLADVAARWEPVANCYSIGAMLQEDHRQAILEGLDTPSTGDSIESFGYGDRPRTGPLYSLDTRTDQERTQRDRMSRSLSRTLNSVRPAVSLQPFLVSKHRTPRPTTGGARSSSPAPLQSAQEERGRGDKNRC